MVRVLGSVALYVLFYFFLFQLCLLWKFAYKKFSLIVWIYFLNIFLNLLIEGPQDNQQNPIKSFIFSEKLVKTISNQLLKTLHYKKYRYYQSYCNWDFYKKKACKIIYKCDCVIVHTSLEINICGQIILLTLKLYAGT